MGTVINGINQFDQRRVRGMHQITLQRQLEAIRRMAREVELEQEVEHQVKTIKAKADAILSPYRLEIAKLAVGYEKGTCVLELLYYHACLQDELYELSQKFVVDHRSEVIAAMGIYEYGIVETRDWINKQHWPGGYDLNKLSYVWHGYLYGWKPSLDRLLKDTM